MFGGVNALKSTGDNESIAVDETDIYVVTSKLTIEAPPNVLGYGVVVLNGASPKPVPRDISGTGMTAGVTRPAPLGIPQCTWNPKQRAFEKGWINKEIDNTDQLGPVVSAKTGLLNAVNQVNADYQVVALDWETGKITARWPFPDGSRLWNTYASITILVEDGDFPLGGFFATERMNVSWVLWAVALVVTVGGVWVGAGRPRAGSRGASGR